MTPSFRACEMGDFDACWTLSTWYLGPIGKQKTTSASGRKVHTSESTQYYLVHSHYFKFRLSKGNWRAISIKLWSMAFVHATTTSFNHAPMWRGMLTICCVSASSEFDE